MPRPRPTVSPIDASPPAADDWADGALGVKAAAAFAGVSRDTLYELMRAGVLTWRRPGKCRLIARSSLARWLASHPSGRG